MSARIVLCRVVAVPGTRVDVGRGNWLMGGVDIPISTSAKPYDFAYHATYILNF